MQAGSGPRHIRRIEIGPGSGDAGIRFPAQACDVRVVRRAARDPSQTARLGGLSRSCNHFHGAFILRRGPVYAARGGPLGSDAVSSTAQPRNQPPPLIGNTPPNRVASGAAKIRMAENSKRVVT